jgi:hypothetical protein
MGMLFNTDDTVEILNLVNRTFNVTGFKRIIFDQNHGGTNWSNLFTNMGSTATYTYPNVAIPLGLDFDIGSPTKTLRSRRWKKFLDYIDATNSGATTTKCSAMIGTAIVAAITAGYSAVEFFAVPGNSMSVTSSNLAISGQTTTIITINTIPIDSM